MDLAGLRGRWPQLFLGNLFKIVSNIMILFLLFGCEPHYVSIHCICSFALWFMRTSSFLGPILFLHMFVQWYVSCLPIQWTRVRHQNLPVRFHFCCPLCLFNCFLIFFFSENYFIYNTLIYHQSNKPFPSCLLSLFQNESSYKTFHIKMSLFA